jgi:XTP/dITP diphosphohydrolase
MNRIKLVFGTSNRNKLEEIRDLIPNFIELLSLEQLGIDSELPETRDTIQGNAIQKVEALHHMVEVNSFAEDTGLEVDALDGAPGVYTARYAGEQKDPTANMERLLRNLRNKGDRSAQFRTAIAMIWDKQTHVFEGVVRGKIALEKKGKGGFGYDPIFIPKGYERTFAELPSEVKQNISHRARALQKMIRFLEEL